MTFTERRWTLADTEILFNFGLPTQADYAAHGAAVLRRKLADCERALAKARAENEALRAEAEALAARAAELDADHLALVEIAHELYALAHPLEPLLDPGVLVQMVQKVQAKIRRPAATTTKGVDP